MCLKKSSTFLLRRFCANPSINFSKMSLNILEEINYARTNPSKYYKKLSDWIKYIKQDKINNSYEMQMKSSEIVM